MPKILVVGGGISGLSAAHYLNKSGTRPILIEKSRVLGGVIQTETRDRCVLEAGPDSFLAAKPAALELIRDLGLQDQVIDSNDHLRITYVLRKGKLVPLPQGLMMMVPTEVWPMVRTPLLGWGTKMRMGLELLRRPRGKQADRSVYEFLIDHYGEEANDYLAEPLLAGVYGGDPRELSVNSVLPRFVEVEAKYGSLSRGVLATPTPKSGGSLFKTLKGGLAQLINALGGSADVVQGEVQTIERTATGFRARANSDWIEAEQIALAMPSHRAATLVGPIHATLADLLRAIPYSSSITVALVYRKSDIGRELRGFGFLVPKRERRHVVACTVVNNKFPFRAPDDKVILRCFMGGASLAESDAALEQIAREELERILGFQAQPLFTKIARWPESMAQYTVGHAQRVKQIQEEIRTIPGLHLLGNAYEGVGIPDCIRLAQRILEPC